ncbi:MAG TPA: hypothetical protein VFQ39_03030 [Longimicrobium sp.]|nr:hypothetical protein [Longimicrobium sp.]
MRLGRACEEIAVWATGRDYEQTAIEWAEAAALVDPTNPKLANLAGRLTRNANEYDRAEVWFKRGLGLSREQNNTVEKIRAHLGYGRLCAESRRLSCARLHLNRGSRIAWKDGPPSLAAEAQHDLCLFLLSVGCLEEAEERARRALRWYPKNHVRLPFFVADVALLFVFQRQFLTAARVLKPVVRLIEHPAARAAVCALYSRALAGAGFEFEAEGLRRRAIKLLEKNPSLEARTRWHLADAERLLSHWEEAEWEAQRAIEVSNALKDRETERHAQRLLSDILARKIIRPQPRRPDPELTSFVEMLKQRISAWSPRRTRAMRPPWDDWVA